MSDEGHDIFLMVRQYADECGPVLRCADCPEWETDVDGESLTEAVRKALRHAEGSEVTS